MRHRIERMGVAAALLGMVCPACLVEPMDAPGDDGDQSDSVAFGAAVSPAPRIFFTDVTSGPKAGGQNDKGAFVTLYGRGFGATRGTSTVTVGGGAVAAYPVWTDKKVTIQLGSAATTGDLVAHVGGLASNGKPFTVRPGNIRFVSTAGSDSDPGTFSKPWKKLSAAKSKLSAGDIVYARDGVNQTSDTSSAALYIGGSGVPSGNAANPIAIVAYPGAKVTIGCTSSGCPKDGVRIYRDHWVIAGMTLKGASGLTQNQACYVDADGIRIVGNTVPAGSYYGLDFHLTSSSKVLGNHVYDHQHSLIYFGGYGVGSDIEVAWNEVHDVADGNGIKFLGHETTDSLTGVRVHDNLVYNTAHPGIWIGNGTAEIGSKPFIQDAVVYNNVVRHAGTNYGGGFNGGCLRIGNDTGYDPTIDIEVLHNTFVDCGKGIRAEDFESAVIRNNIIVQPGRPFFDAGGSTGTLDMDHNLYWNLNGSTSAPAQDDAPIKANPLFVDQAAYNFRLQPGSPAFDAGVGTMLVKTDFDGIARPDGAAPDLGAFECFGCGVQPAPQPVIMDNGDPGTSSAGQTTAAGVWQISGIAGYYGDGALYSKTVGDTYTYTIDVPAAGKYNVYAWWSATSSRTPSVPIKIHHASGTTTVNVDQRVNGSKWNLLGGAAMTFSSKAVITITATSSSSSTCADAVKIEPAP